MKTKMAKDQSLIDLSEHFPLLSTPPIVEAVIHWQARAQNPWDFKTIQAQLSEQLSNYPNCQPVEQFSIDATMTETEPAPIVKHHTSLLGYRLTSNDTLDVALFTRDGVAFSRMKPYEDWQQFTASATNVWLAFEKIYAPVEIQRLGVRFVNHIPAATLETIAEYLKEPPTCPSNLPLKEFLYQSTFSVPDRPYGIRVIKLVQPTILGQSESSGLYLDIDVYTTKPIDCSDRDRDLALREMRWLKNKVFFDLLTDRAIKSFQGG